jgi:hypothetical protein
MSDHFHLVNQLAHHDAAIGALGSRMTGVEASLTHVQERVGALDNKVSAGFSSVEALIRENRATQGPSMPDVMRGLVTGGALIAMSAGAITVLVTSFVNPDLVALDHKTTALSERLTVTSDQIIRKIDSVERVHDARLDDLDTKVTTHIDAPGHRGSNAVQEAQQQRLDRLEGIVDRKAAAGVWSTDVRRAP